MTFTTPAATAAIPAPVRPTPKCTEAGGMTIVLPRTATNTAGAAASTHSSVGIVQRDRSDINRGHRRDRTRIDPRWTFVAGFGVPTLGRELLLVPAVMHLLGDKAWYMPRWLDRLLPNLTIEPPHKAEESDDAFDSDIELPRAA